jgi:DNA-binding transcriptional LysR family regulator
MTPSLRQLEYFVAVVDEGSFTRAAELLHVTQPGLSHQIQALERELGGPLLERLPRNVRLTPVGRSVLPHARASLAHAERVGAVARRAAGLDAVELHIGTLYSISVGVMPTALLAWRRHYPDAQAHLVEFRHAGDLAAGMDAGRADIAVGPAPADWSGPAWEIGAEEFVIVAHPDAGLPPEQTRIRIADLAGAVWVHFTTHSGLSEYVEEACAAAGFQPRVGIRTEQGASALALARAGLGVTLLPANVIPPGFDGVVLRPDPPISRMLSVYARDTLDPITTSFVASVTDEAPVTPPHLTGRLGLPSSSAPPARAVP